MVPATDRPSDVLPTPGRPHEAEDRRARVGLQLAHGEELEDAVLHQVDVVVVAVEVLASLLEVERVLAETGPRKRGEPLEVGPDHAVLHRLRRQPLEALQLPLGDLAGVLGQGGLLKLLAQVVGLGLRLVDLAELLLDRLELLAQPVLALTTVHLRLNLGLDAGADLHELELAGEHLREHPQPARHVALLEELLLLLGLDPQRPGDRVRELRRVVEVRDRDLELLGQVGDLLDDPREHRLHVAVERLELGRRLDLVRRLLDAGDHVGLGAHELLELHALSSVHEDPKRPVGHLEHPRHHAGHAHAIDVVRARLLDLRVLAHHHHEHPVPAEHVVHELDRALLADRERSERLGEGHGVPQRQDRQHLGEGRADDGLGGLAVCRRNMDAHSSSPSSMGTRRTSSAGASGISTSRMPSS